MKAKKQIKKLENRIEKIEKELARNSSFTLSKYVFRGITEPKLPIEEKPFVLPEKWCVLVTEENTAFLNEYLYNNKEKYKNFSEYWDVEPGTWFLSENKEEPYHSYECFPHDNVYTEITFEQFKQHVLKEDLTLSDVQVNVEDCSEKEIKELADIFVANGFNLYNHESILNLDEIYCFLRLVKQTDRLGVFNFDPNKTTLTPSQFREMFGKKEIDWSRGQYVKNSKGSVWLVMKDVDKTYFKGVMLLNEGKEDILYATKILKRDMTLCTEPITLNN